MVNRMVSWEMKGSPRNVCVVDRYTAPKMACIPQVIACLTFSQLSDPLLGFAIMYSTLLFSDPPENYKCVRYYICCYVLTTC